MARDSSRALTGFRIVVTGDEGTGKSSLIATFADGNPVKDVPPVLLPTRMPKHLSPDGIPITIIDTSSRPEDRDKVAEQIRRADAIVLTYACDRQETLESLSAFWLPRLRDLGVNVPIIVAACKLDLLHDNQEQSLEKVMQPVIQKFPEVEINIGCSAYTPIGVADVFAFAQKSVISPSGPLYCRNSKTLTPRFVRALKRIFIHCDCDRDGALNAAELNDFQVKYVEDPMPLSRIANLMRFLRDRFPEGVNESGLTFAGFQSLHIDFMNILFREIPWTMLRKFGYNDDIKLADHLIPDLKRDPDQSVELTNEALDFLKKIFVEFDINCDGYLQPEELEELFSTAPESPWIGAPYKDAADESAFRGLSIDAFLSKWALMTLLEPTFSVENLIYIGFPSDPSTAVRVTRRRSLDRKMQHSDRNVLQCFVFGPRGAGKSALLKSFIRWPYLEVYNPTNGDHYVVNVVDNSMGNKKYLVLREISEDGVGELLANNKSLASCDIAVFVHDRSDESSWRSSSELLVEIARHGEDNGFEVPCLIVAAKDEQNSFPTATQELTRVSQDLGVEAPIPISVMLGNLNGLFCRIVTAAEHPHLSIPETEVRKSHRQYHHLIIPETEQCPHSSISETEQHPHLSNPETEQHPHLRIPETEVGNSRKLYNRLINNPLLFVSAGAAAAVVGVTLFSVRKNAQVLWMS